MPQRKRIVSTMADATILSGKPLRDLLFGQARAVSSRLRQKGIMPKLAVVVVGNNPASQVYVKAKMAAAADCGIESTVLRLPERTRQSTLHTRLNALNEDPSVYGVLLQLPLPKHLNSAEALEWIHPHKDVDGLTAVNAGKLEIGAPDGLTPCTPLGVLRLLEAAGVELKGTEVVVVGRSNLVGRPIASLLGQRHATVTTCHRYTENLAAHIKRADLVVLAAGSPGLVRGAHLKKGAAVIDVGITPVDVNGLRKLLGDAHDDCRGQARLLTPVPGGVGPMTVASLMTNTLDATCLQNGLPRPRWKIR